MASIRQQARIRKASAVRAPAAKDAGAQAYTCSWLQPRVPGLGNAARAIALRRAFSPKDRAVRLALTAYSQCAISCSKGSFEFHIARQQKAINIAKDTLVLCNRFLVLPVDDKGVCHDVIVQAL